MTKIEIYTTPFCGFCYRAKYLLEVKGVEYEEIDISKFPEKRQEMVERTNANSVPQILVNNLHIGDCEKIHTLEAQGQLDVKLQIEK